MTVAQIQSSPIAAVAANSFNALANLRSFNYDDKQWQKWVRTSGMARKAVLDYYIGISYAKGTLHWTERNAADRQLERVLRELFLDAISVGAVTLLQPLPTRVKVADLEFVIYSVPSCRGRIAVVGVT